MFRMPFAVTVILVGFTAGSSRADVIPLFSDVPATYVPGTSFTFLVTVPEVNGLSNYNVDLIFDAAVNSPNLTVSAAPSPNEYVFPTSSGFSTSSFTGPGPNEVSVQFSDSILPNYVTTVTGVNDVLGVITVNPGSDLTGPITVSFDPSTFVNYFSEGNDTPDNSVTIDQGTAPPAPVPTPAAWMSMAIGALVLLGRERVKNHRRNSPDRSPPTDSAEPAEASEHLVSNGQTIATCVSRLR